jgi:hypothetical protein
MGKMRGQLYILIASLFVLVIPKVALSQTINLVTHSTFNVAGNGSIVGSNYGEVRFNDEYGNYVSPALMEVILILMAILSTCLQVWQRVSMVGLSIRLLIAL